MKRKKLAAFGLVIALTASSSSAAFAAAVPAASNMETTAVQQMDQAEETDTDILSDSEAVELQQEIASYSNDGILLTAAAPSTIGGVATTDIINAAKVMIRKYEGSYSSVNANDNGALSIGKMQWHADRAKSLLRIIISGDAASAQAILGDALYNEILSDASWSKRILTTDEAKKMQTLLATTQSQLAQDVQENTEDESVAILTEHEYCLVYESEEGKTMVQASSRAYVYQSTNDPYHARTTTSRHYHSFYYFRGYSRDASRYNNRASGYQNYDGTAPEYNYSDTYRTYSNTVRQGSTGTRTSSGGGIGFGK